MSGNNEEQIARSNPQIAFGDVPKTISYWRLLTSHAGVTRRVLTHEYVGSGTEDDPYAVSWIQDDPRNPMQLPTALKITITVVMSFAVLIVSLSSSAYIGSVKWIIEEFQVSTEVAILGLSLFILGFSLGPLFWAPLSETIGRQIPFFVAFFVLAAFSAGCGASPTIEALIIQRALVGAFASAPLANAGGVLSDMFRPEHRGLALCLFSAAPYLGPSLGPSIGGFLGMAAGWRWVEWFLAASSLLVWLLVALFVPETYAPVLLRARANKLSRITGKCYRSSIDLEKGKPRLSKRLKTSLSRPWVLLIREPIVSLFTFYAAIIYGTLYMMFAAFPFVYEMGRGWNPGVGGLPFLGITVGTLLGTTYTFFDNKRYVRTQQLHDGNAPPEARLPPCMVSAISIPISLMWFAWTNSPGIHWLVSVAALVPFGLGMILVYNGLINYLLDAYTISSASVLSSLACVRYMFGVFFPLFTTPMYRALGIHWASSIPAFVSILCIPIPFVFYRYGALIRTKCKYSREAQMHAKKVQEVLGSDRQQVRDHQGDEALPYCTRRTRGSDCSSRTRNQQSL